MVQFRVGKVVVVALLEATKVTLEHVGVQRMELAERGVDDSRKLMSLYGEVRRLKDYLHRCVGAFREDAELDIADGDLPLLSACCKRGAEAADLRLSTCTDMRERNLLQQRRDLLLDWAVELAADRQLTLPLTAMPNSSSPLIRSMQSRIMQKLARSQPTAGMPTTTTTPFAGAPGVGNEISASIAAGVGRPADGPAAATQSNESRTAAATVEESEPEPPRLLDISRIRDQRLRAIMALDLRALSRAIAASDYRLAAVHLTSVLEGAILDHAMPRTLEFGLHGTPESWNPQEVLLRVFGEECGPRERAAAYHVFATLSLLHPAQQLKVPIVVTAVSFKKNLEFVELALRRMGFTT
jgi:hypothetical protein